MSLVTVQQAAANAALVRPYINQQWAAALVKKLGYDWPPERIERIAADMGEGVAASVPASWALASAFDLELVMYGDGSMSELVGLLP